VTQTDKKRPQSSLRLDILWFFLKPYKMHIAVLFILALLVGGLEAINIAAIYPILSTAFEVGAEQSNLILSLLGGAAGLLPIGDEFIAYCIVFLIIAILTSAAKFAFIRFRINLSVNLAKDNQNEVYYRYATADYQYFIDHKEGELLYNASTAPLRVTSLVTSITELMAQVVLSISVLALLFSLSWQGTCAALVIGLGYYYLARSLGQRISYYSAQKELDSQKAINVMLNESVGGIKQVKVFLAVESWIKRFHDIVSTRWHYFGRRSVYEQVLPVILVLILYLSVGIIPLIIKLVSPANFTQLIPTFGTFAMALFRLFYIVGASGGLLMGIMAVIPDCEAVYSVLKERTSQIRDGKKELASFKSSIKLNNVSFAYKGRNRVVEDISVTFEKGKTTAIVGRSGSGKTTIINLLLRLFEPDKGEIMIDGADIKEYKLSSWLSKIGYVSQETFIFNDSTEKNITFRSDRFTHKDVVQAAENADAHTFISTELPEGYGTMVGDRGVRLSGGQRQRIAIARAIIRKPDIWIFDEATNALDNVSEVSVQNSINKIARDHTVIVIAHRLSTIFNADKIIVLENGRLVEEGTHEELLKNRGAYWNLYKSQPL
jgi:ABC-type multidrug transport system fused ATPase/permease subunit